MAMQVQGKTAIVTGAGSGINLCFAKLLLEKGCNVVFADLVLRPEAQAVVDQYSQASSGPRAVFVKVDVTDWAQLENMCKVAMEHFSGIDIVCPGAGVYEPPFSNFWYPPGTPPSRDDPTTSRFAIIDINITHPIRLTQIAIAHFLKECKPGVIVHITSIAGQLPFFPTPVYVASKHAISGFVRSLYRLEDPPAGSNIPKIRVNAVAPAMILTPLWTDNPDKMKLVQEGKVDWVTPEKVAEVMVELVEKEEYAGGSVIEVGTKVRRVQPFNDPGPPMSETALGPNMEEDMWASLERQMGGKE